jgi:hypothetical protein
LISDVYTYRLQAGEILLIVDGPTDYNQDGIISGRHEQRLEIGTLHREADPSMFAAVSGRANYDSHPTSLPRPDPRLRQKRRRHPRRR